MSSGLYCFGTSFHHSTSEMASSDGVGVGGGDTLIFSSSSSSDPFTFFTNDSTNHNTPFDIEPLLSSSSSVSPFSPAFFSFSPPSTILDNLSLQGNHREFASFSAFDEVKSEECQIGDGVDYAYGQQFLPHSYSGAENLSKYMMQRSFSSNSFEGKPGNFLFQNRSGNLNMENNSPNFQNSPQNGQMRRVCSAGDLQNMKANHTSGSSMEEPNFKVGRYSAEERKERISKYRTKRSQRNFNKTIKYACRKTLADHRPRIRGRFARNDEAGEIPKAPCSTRDEEEVDFWIEGLRLHEEQEDLVTVGAEQYVNGYGATQFQYYGF